MTWLILNTIIKINDLIGLRNFAHISMSLRLEFNKKNGT